MQNTLKISPSRRSSVIVVDDFYEDPLSIRKRALELTFYRDENFFHGQRTLERFATPELREVFSTIIGQKIARWDEHAMNGVFQICMATDPIVYHADAQRWAAMIQQILLRRILLMGLNSDWLIKLPMCLTGWSYLMRVGSTLRLVILVVQTLMRGCSRCFSLIRYERFLVPAAPLEQLNPHKHRVCCVLRATDLGTPVLISLLESGLEDP